MFKKLCVGFVAFMFSGLLLAATAAIAEEGREWDRPSLWNPFNVQMVDTTKYKKKPPYVFGMANAGTTNTWALLMQLEVQAEAEKYPKLIKKVYVTDAHGKADKQINDIEDLITKGCDIILTRCATEAGLNPLLTRLHKQNFPVVTISKGIKSPNYVSYVAATNYAMGRMQALWIAQMLKGKGNIVILAGWPGAGSVVERWIGGQEALARYPGIKILDRQYTHYSASEGKTVMQAMIQTYGDKIDAVWADSGLQGSGAIEAMVEAGMKPVPITGDQANCFCKRVIKYNFPAMSVFYPPSMGADAVKVGLRILQGIPVPKYFNSDALVITTQDTRDIKADVRYVDVVKMNKPDTFWPGHTLPQKWLPKDLRD